MAASNDTIYTRMRRRGGAGPSGLERLNIHHIIIYVCVCVCAHVYKTMHCCRNRCSKPYYIYINASDVSAARESNRRR